MTMWSVDPRIDEARKHPGWTKFHRECGNQNFYIEHIEKKGRGYIATCFRLRDRMSPPYIMYPMESGEGRTPIDACVAAYHKAVEIGHCEGGLERLFNPVVEDDDDLIGGAPIDDDEDLIG